MKAIYIAFDGTQFTSKVDCLNYEIENKRLFKCDACQGLGYTYGKKFIKVRELIYDRWAGGECEIETEKVVDVTNNCPLCIEGYRNTPLVPKYKVHKEFIGYESE